MSFLLVLLGVLPLAAMPFFTGGDDLDSSDETEGSDDEMNLDLGSTEGGDMLDDPNEYVLANGSGETVIDGFEPGTSHLTLSLGDGGAGDFVLEPYGETGDGITLRYEEAGEDGAEGESTSVSFTGLAELPVGDIDLELYDPTTGETSQLALSDVWGDAPLSPDVSDDVGLTEGPDTGIAPDVGDDTGGTSGEEVTDPLHPIVDDADVALMSSTEVVSEEGAEAEAPLAPVLDDDTGGLGGEDPETVLAASDPDAADTLGGEDPDEVLAPVVDEAGYDVPTGDGTQDGSTSELQTIEGSKGDDELIAGEAPSHLIGADGDDTLQGSAGADLLEGGAGNDTLIMSDGDVATGGEGADTFWLYHNPELGEDIAEVSDFAPGEDFLRVSLNPDMGYDGDSQITVEPSDDGADGLVLVDGDIVALLRGAPGATLADIHVEMRSDIFN